jgi:hypothetical protein
MSFPETLRKIAEICESPEKMESGSTIEALAKLLYGNQPIPFKNLERTQIFALQSEAIRWMQTCQHIEENLPL